MLEKRGLIVYALPYVIIVSLQFEFAKDGLRYADPLTFMALRYLIASFVTFLYARSFRPQINKDTVLVSIFSFLSILVWILGLQRVSPAESAVLSYTYPLFAIPLSTLILNERSSRMGYIGTLVGFVGVSIYAITLAGNEGTILGDSFTIFSAVFWALVAVYYRKMRYDALRIIGTQFLLCGILFSVMAPFSFSITVTSEFLVDLSFMSVFAGFCTFILFNAMLRREKVGRITTLAFAIPALTTLIQTIKTGAVPSPITLSGIGLMFLGIYISRFLD